MEFFCKECKTTHRSDNIKTVVYQCNTIVIGTTSGLSEAERIIDSDKFLLNDSPITKHIREEVRKLITDEDKRIFFEALSKLTPEERKEILGERFES